MENWRLQGESGENLFCCAQILKNNLLQNNSVVAISLKLNTPRLEFA